MKTITIGPDIRARLNESQHWEIKHPGLDGKMSRWYSTGLAGTEKDLRRHLKEENIEDLVAIGKRGALTEKVIAQLTSGSVRPSTLVDVADGWLEWMLRNGRSPQTIRQYESYYHRWLSDFNLHKKPISKIDLSDMDPFVNPQDSSIKRAARASRMHMLHSLFGYLAAMGYCSGNPSQLVRVNTRMMTHAQKETKTIESYTAQEVRTMLSYLDQEIQYAQQLVKSGAGNTRVRKPYARLKWMEFWKFAIRSSYEIGLRLGDICTLEWASLADSDHIIVWTAKRESRVQIPLSEFSDELKRAIDSIPCTDATYCFPEIAEKYRASRSTASSYFTRLCEEAKVPVKSFHALRHTAIRRMKKRLEDGTAMSPDEILLRIGKIVAHSNPSTTRGYL